jgi:transcriptional regulator with XRE-family HTH domain
MMNLGVNVSRIVRAMEAKQLKIVDACALCGVNNKTLAKILRGEVPRRIDALYRVVNGLQIPIQEALIAPTHKATQGPRLHVVFNRRKSDEVA